MFLVLRKKTVLAVSIILILVAILSVCAVLIFDALDTTASQYTHIVVLDAGHGGVDTGVKGINSGANESDINLIIVKAVAERLENNNVKAVLTRTTEAGLYGDDMNNFKRRDMEARRDIIEQTKPQLVVSIHCNKFPDKSRRGAQCFFAYNSEPSKQLASALQTNLNEINKTTCGREFDALKGDYYILNCSSVPSAIVECGFLSNPEDDALLNDEAHRNAIADKIVAGIMASLS